jgi:flagellar L-ring protein FlgH
MNRIVTSLAVALLALGAGADSLFSARVAEAGTLISDKKARFEVGDIIVVLVREKIDASTTSGLNTKKESEVEAKAGAKDNRFLISDAPGGLNILSEEMLPNWKIEIENEHKGNGSTKRSNTLVTTITCSVTEVFSNGNVAIEGEKKVTVNRDDSTLFVRGVIRSRDVSASNTVQSNQVANAVIELRGQGPLWNNQRRGLFTRFLDWFSPF